MSKSLRTSMFVTLALACASVALYLGVESETVEAQAKITRSAAAPAATFAGTNVGAIPDRGVAGCGAPAGPARDVMFNVTALSGAPTNVEINMTFGAPVHTWVGDVNAVLIAPNGASHTVFGRTGSTTAAGCGDSSDLAGPYHFADSAATPPSGGWWQEATARADTEALTSGTYRTTGMGGLGATNPMPPTNMSPAFAGVADPNGTWILRLTDFGGGDTGAIAAATLTIDAGPVGPTAAPNVDFDGDGVSDFSVARAEGVLAEISPMFSNVGSVRERMQLLRERGEVPVEEGGGLGITWYIHNSNDGTATIASFGLAATDFIVPNDYDGDGKADIAVWRPGAPGVAAFHILQSSNSTVRTDVFGQAGDDPAITGDYDGDGTADVATYRCPPFPTTGQCFFFFRGSLNNPGGNISFVPWGNGTTGDFFVNPGDFDGDGKYDFCIQRAFPGDPALGEFALLRSSDLGANFIRWGLSSDFILPGDYDGDGKHDLAVRRTVGGVRQHFILRSSDLAALGPINFGITGDFSVPGDYDGDGKTDIAVWRPNPDPDQNFYWVLRSSDLAVTTFEWGISVDFPVAAWHVH